VGAKFGLRRDVGAFERDSKPGAPVLRAAWIRALQDPEGVPEEVVRTEKAQLLSIIPRRQLSSGHSPPGNRRARGPGGLPAWNNGEEGFWRNISQHDRMLKWLQGSKTRSIGRWRNCGTGSGGSCRKATRPRTTRDSKRNSTYSCWRFAAFRKGKRRPFAPWQSGCYCATTAPLSWSIAWRRGAT